MPKDIIGAMRGDLSLEYNFDSMRKLYDACAKVCKPDCYNLVLHKHLGDLVALIAAKDHFEKKFGHPLRFIIPHKYEFLMYMFDIADYSVVNIDEYLSLYFHKNGFSHSLKKGSSSQERDSLVLSCFSSIPHKGTPFIAESTIIKFNLFDRYFARFWHAHMELPLNISLMLPVRKNPLSLSARERLESIAPINKIVLFAPDAVTATEFAPEFWNIIAERVHAHGYKIIVNSKKYNIAHGISAFDLNLSLSDIVALGLSCAYVFSLRSGLCDALVGAGPALYAFYPAMLRREMNGLNRIFTPSPRINEIGVYDWKIDSIQWEGENLTPALQKHINFLHRNYCKERIKHFFFRAKNSEFWKKRYKNVAGRAPQFADNNNNKENIKIIHNKNIKFLGFSLYKKTIVDSDTKTPKIKIYILSGLIYILKIPGSTKRVHILGVSFISRKFSKYRKRIKIFGVCIYRNNETEKFLKSILNQISDEYDDIYLIRYNIGESFVYLSHLSCWMKANGSRNPLLITWREKDIPFYRMFLPENISWQYVKLEAGDVHTLLNRGVINLGQHRLFCPRPNIEESLKKNFAKKLGANFYDFILDDMKIDRALPPRSPQPSFEAQERTDRALKALGISEKFVIFCPEAVTLKGMSDQFWRDLARGITGKGYDIFWNTTQKTIKFENAKTYDLTIEEVYTLASKSRGIITLASGLALLLTATGKPLDLIYTDFKDNTFGYSSSITLKVYSSFHIPGVQADVVKEYDTAKIKEEALIKLILERY